MTAKKISITEIFNLMSANRENYGIYWVVNKLVKINAETSQGNDIEGYAYSAWVSNRDTNFILPKLDQIWYKGGRYYQMEIVRSYGVINVSYKVGNNGNMCISLTFIPHKN